MQVREDEKKNKRGRGWGDSERRDIALTRKLGIKGERGRESEKGGKRERRSEGGREGGRCL